MDVEEWGFVTQLTQKEMWEKPSLMDLETFSTCSKSSSKPLKITFNEPAKYWTDAVPIGNGRLGAMVWGGVSSELIQLNEDTLWTGIPGNYTDPDAPTAVSEVRRLVDNGQFAEATEAANRLLGTRADLYQLLGDLKIEFDDSHLPYSKESYYRELDLDTATVQIKYTAGDAEFTREHFASNPDQAIVTKICGSKSGLVSFVVSLDTKLNSYSYVHGPNQIILEGNCPGQRIPSQGTSNDVPMGIKFAAILAVTISEKGVIRVLDGNKLKVEGSDWAMLTLVAASSFQGPFVNPADSTKDPTSESFCTLNLIQSLSYADLRARHVEDYQNLYHRVSLHLEKSLEIGVKESNLVPTVERIKSFRSDEDPSFVELLFQFGRYLLISCSRPGTQVANLQGIWNKDLKPIFGSSLVLDINLEMNYWPSFPCNLMECQEPLYDLIKSLAINGSKTVQVNYKANGWVVHHKTDIWAKSSIDGLNVKWDVWQLGGAWLCTHLWEHYVFTLDKDFLENTAYPLLEGCALFLLDWLIEGNEGYLETNPSISPEHEFIGPDGKLASVSYSSTMDMTIIREVFRTILSASKVLGRDEDALVKRVRKDLPRLLPTKVAADGSIMEWAQDFQDPEVHHRHLSPLFGIFPGHTISVEKNPDLCKAAENTLFKRGVDGPGWSSAWKIALWARLQNSDNAYKMVKHLVTLVDPEHEVPYTGGLYSNLFAAHPPFQIDANFGFTAAIAEMLVQSTLQDLYLLPALPREKWGNGHVKGLKARGGLTVNLSWKEGNLHEVSVWLKDGSSLHNLHYRGTRVVVRLASGTIYRFNGWLKCIETRDVLGF